MRFESRRGQNEKNCVLQFEKMYFLYCYLLAGLLVLHCKDDLQSLRRCSYNILNHSKWRRIEKDLPKCSVIRQVIDDEPIYPKGFQSDNQLGKTSQNREVTKHIQYNQTSLLIMNAHTLIMEYLLMKFDQKALMGMCARAQQVMIFWSIL